jgi:hypothetical protein
MAAQDESLSNQVDTAEYVADISANLAILARSADLTFLAHLLDVARREAQEVARQARREPKVSA